MLHVVDGTGRIPDAPPTMNALERHIWYADRLREAAITFNPEAETHELAALYHTHYNAHGYPPPTNDTDDSWVPVNLNTLPDQPPIKPTLGGIGIVYPGLRHVFSGPPESAKTLAAYAIALHIVRAGHPIVLFDFEMGAYETRGRLTELGATPQDLDNIHYLEPDERATDARINILIALQPKLVLLDAAAGVFDLEQLKDNDRGDVEKLAGIYIRPFWRAGIATILIDHVVKNTETRGKYAIGSERKLGGTDVHLGFETITPISRGTRGLYKIHTHKDRGGYLKRGHLANLELNSDPETHRLTWQLTAPTDDTSPDGYFRPTHLMEKVSAYLELQPEPVTRNTVAAAIGGTKKWVLDAITALVTENFIHETDGPNRSRPVKSTRPYRENDPACNPETPEENPVVRSGSEWFAEPDSVSGSGGSPPYGGDTKEPPHPDHPEEHQWFATQNRWLDDLAHTVDLDITPDPPED